MCQCQRQELNLEPLDLKTLSGGMQSLTQDLSEIYFDRGLIACWSQCPQQERTWSSRIH